MTAADGMREPGAATGPGGSIYDLGYRRYDGPRLGRRHAIAALFRHTLLSCYGIGRGGRAKIAPLVFGGMAVIPAVIAVGITALARQAGQAGQVIESASPLRYETYYGVISQILVLFCAAQAPELVGRDQRYHVLPLYFSRALERTDYALAKYAGFVAAILIFVLLPQLVIFVGLILSAADPASAVGDNLAKLPPILIEGLLLAGLYGGLSLAIAAFTPRRAYATATIIAAIIIPGVVVEIANQISSQDLSRWLVLLSPGDVMHATNAWLFGIAPTRAEVVDADHPGGLYAIVTLLAIAVAVVLLLRRYERIEA